MYFFIKQFKFYTRLFSFLLSLQILFTQSGIELQIYHNESQCYQSNKLAPESKVIIPSESSDQAPFLKSGSVVVYHLLNPELWQSWLLIATIVVALFWNSHFEEYKTLFLIPLAVFEGLLLFAHLIKFAPNQQSKQTVSEKLSTSFTIGGWFVVSALFTPFVMDTISIQLFSCYDGWGVAFVVTCLIIRRLFLFIRNSVNLLFFIWEYATYKKFEKRSKPVLNLKAKRKPAGLIAGMFWLMLLGGIGFFSTADFSKVSPIFLISKYLSQNQKDYLVLQQEAFLNYLGWVKDGNGEFVPWFQFASTQYTILDSGKVSKETNLAYSQSLLSKLLIPERIRFIREYVRLNSQGYRLTHRELDINNILSKMIRFLNERGISSLELETKVLREMLESDSQEIRLTAAMILGVTHEMEALPKIMELANSEPEDYKPDSSFFPSVMAYYEAADESTRRKIGAFAKNYILSRPSSFSRPAKMLPLLLPKSMFEDSNQAGFDILFSVMEQDTSFLFESNLIEQQFFYSESEGDSIVYSDEYEEYLKFIEGAIRYGAERGKEEATKKIIFELMGLWVPPFNEVYELVKKLGEDTSLPHSIRNYCASDRFLWVRVGQVRVVTVIPRATTSPNFAQQAAPLPPSYVGYFMNILRFLIVASLAKSCIGFMIKRRKVKLKKSPIPTAHSVDKHFILQNPEITAGVSL